jgi:hypothetical protein
MASAAPALAAFTKWLTSYGDAWEQADAELAGSLFAVGATLQDTPFSQLLRGRKQIREHLYDLFEDWDDATFSAQILGAGDTYGVAHWRIASPERAIDGVLVAALDDRGRCTSLRQWYHESRRLN